MISYLYMTVTRISLQKQIEYAARVLRKGGVIAFPTETTYGLGCDPRNLKAVRRIYKLKGRDYKKPLLLVASSVAQVRRVAELHAASFMLQEKYWPGPLTLVLPIRKPSTLVSGVAVKGEVAIRVSSSSIVQMLTRQLGFPIVATSANRTGQAECRSSRAVRAVFDGDIDYILDAGALPKRKLSTVARVQTDGTIEVIRAGAIKLS